MSSDAIIRSLLDFAEEQLVPQEYALFVDVIDDLIVAGLSKALTERLMIEELDVSIETEEEKS